MWKDIKNYEGIYQVNVLGEVKNIKFNRILKNVSTGKYLKVVLFKKGKGKQYLIHRLISEYFIPNPSNKPCINHINGDGLDNRLDNLEWVTHKENINHAWDNNMCFKKYGFENPACKISDLSVLTIREWKKLCPKTPNRIIGSYFGISRQHCDDLIKGRKRHHARYNK